MKSIIYATTIACLALLPGSLWAQSETKDAEKTPKLVLGLQAGLLHSADNQWNYHWEGPSRFNLNGYGFVRYYMGKHFALETGFSKMLSTVATGGVSYYSGGVTLLTDKMQITSWSVPVHLQYHLCTPESKIRPYFGLGIGLGEKGYHYDYRVIDNGKEESRHVLNKQAVGYVQFTQGVTWQLNNRLQLNQSFTYRLGGQVGGGLNFGLGYTINK